MNGRAKKGGKTQKNRREITPDTNSAESYFWVMNDGSRTDFKVKADKSPKPKDAKAAAMKAWKNHKLNGAITLEHSNGSRWTFESKEWAQDYGYVESKKQRYMKQKQRARRDEKIQVA